MAALFGVLSVVNVYTGTMFDIIFIYLMTVALAYYTFKFNEKMAVLVLFTSTFILFLTGELFFTLYSFFTLPLGILYIYFSIVDYSNVYGPLAALVMLMFSIAVCSEAIYFGMYVIFECHIRRLIKKL